jgi:hypothetical protein
MRKLASVYRDYAKNHSSRLATYFTAGPLAKIQRWHLDIRLPALQVIKFTLTKYFFTVYQFVPRRSTGPLPFPVSGNKFVCLDNFLRQPHKLANAEKKIGFPLLMLIK